VIQPVPLSPNQPRHFYKGGASIAEWRGVPAEDDFRPEDWVGSTTTRFGMAPLGLSVLPDGRYLRDAVESDAEDWLGPEHAAYFGTSTGLLVKLLDAGQRLPVHYHPPRRFAYQHLGSRHGKTEAWIVLGTRGSAPAVYLGWSRDVEPDELARWVEAQDTDAMLGNLNKLAVRPGDALVVPAGTAHAIGEGVFSIELQEPTDFSMMLEVEGFGVDRGPGDLGLGRDVALSCVQREAFSPAMVEQLRSSRGQGVAPDALPPIEDVFPAAARPYFRAQRVRGGATGLEASFAVVLGVEGSGDLVGDGWQLRVDKGSTFAVPWGAGTARAEGDFEFLRCLPPLPADAVTDDPAAADDPTA
jgi:mannose-6-phosphate isomerase